MNDRDIEESIASIPLDRSTEERLTAFAAVYSAATAQGPIDLSLSASREALHSWFHEHHELLLANLLRTVPARSFVLHADVKSKANAVAQIACPTCGPPIRTFPIGVEPWSAQSTRNKVAIREAVNEGLHGMPAERAALMEGPLCLSVVSVVPRKTERRKDVDNLVKGLLDSLAGYLYEDDRLIQCLTTRRLEYAGDVGYYVVGVRSALPFDADVIFDDPGRPRIAWGDLRV